MDPSIGVLKRKLVEFKFRAVLAESEVDAMDLVCSRPRAACTSALLLPLAWSVSFATGQNSLNPWPS